MTHNDKKTTPVTLDDIMIRKAQRHDLQTIARFIGQLFAMESDFEPNEEKQYEGMKILFDTPDSHMLVAKYKNSVIGMITMQPLVSSAEGGWVGLIEDVYIEEGFRHLGLGTTLVNKMKEIAREKGYKRLQLVADKNNPLAEIFYGKQGFHKANLTTYHHKNF